MMPVTKKEVLARTTNSGRVEYGELCHTKYQYNLFKEEPDAIHVVHRLVPKNKRAYSPYIYSGNKDAWSPFSTKSIRTVTLKIDEESSDSR